MRAKGFVEHSFGDREGTTLWNTKSEQKTPSSLAQLFETHNQALVRYLTTIMGSSDDAGEIAQEAYARLLRLDCIETISHLRAYLFKIARNIAIDRLRSRTRQARLLKHIHMHDEEPISIDDPENMTIAMELITDLESVIRELPPKCQTAFIMYKFRNKSYCDIATKMELTESMVRKYVQRALVHCHQRLWQEE